MDLETKKVGPVMASGVLKKTSPWVYNYTDFREYLKDYYDFKKKESKHFSYSTFASKARVNSRSYLKRIIDGERSISINLLPGICDGLSLKPQERLYFENLVQFNQAKDNRAKDHYFMQLKELSALQGKSSPFELASDQYEVYSNWYIMSLFEFCAIKYANQDPKSVAKQFGGRLTAKEIKGAFQLLEKLSLIYFDKSTKRFVQAHKKTQYSKNVVSLAIQKFHKAILSLAEKMIDDSPLDERFLRSLSIAVSKSEAKEIISKVDHFINELNSFYSETGKEKEVLLQVNSQVLTLIKEVEKCNTK